MSYELDHIEKACACPCGKGRIIYGSGTNDWNQVREGMREIECPDCIRKYKFTSDGLLPIDFPDYQGDLKVYAEISRLKEIISNYRGMLGIRYWSKELKQKRINLYLTEEEIIQDKTNGLNDCLIMALGFSRNLAKKYSLDELEEINQQLSKCSFSTQLSGNAYGVALEYQRHYKSIKPSNVIIPVKMAIRNYHYYKEAEKEDEEYINLKKKEVQELEKIYYKDYEEYEKNRLKKIFQYKLIDV